MCVYRRRKARARPNVAALRGCLQLWRAPRSERTEGCGTPRPSFQGLPEKNASPTNETLLRRTRAAEAAGLGGNPEVAPSRCAVRINLTRASTSRRRGGEGGGGQSRRNGSPPPSGRRSPAVQRLRSEPDDPKPARGAVTNCRAQADNYASRPIIRSRQVAVLCRSADQPYGLNPRVCRSLLSRYS